MYELGFPKFHCITSIEISEYVWVEISKVSLSIDALLQMKRRSSSYHKHALSTYVYMISAPNPI